MYKNIFFVIYITDTWMPNLVKRVSNKRILLLMQCWKEIRDYRQLSNQCKELVSRPSGSNIINME